MCVISITALHQYCWHKYTDINNILHKKLSKSEMSCGKPSISLFSWVRRLYSCVLRLSMWEFANFEASLWALGDGNDTVSSSAFELSDRARTTKVRPVSLGDCLHLISKGWSSSIGRKSLEFGYISPERIHISADGGDFFVYWLYRVDHPLIHLRQLLLQRINCVKDDNCVQPRQAMGIVRHVWLTAEKVLAKGI